MYEILPDESRYIRTRQPSCNQFATPVGLAEAAAARQETKRQAGKPAAKPGNRSAR
jgi:hypothetical protein